MEKVTENNTVDTCIFVFNLKHDWAEHIAQYGHYKKLQWLDQKYGGAQNGYPTYHKEISREAEAFNSCMFVTSGIVNNILYTPFRNLMDYMNNNPNHVSKIIKDYESECIAFRNIVTIDLLKIPKNQN